MRICIYIIYIYIYIFHVLFTCLLRHRIDECSLYLLLGAPLLRQEQPCRRGEGEIIHRGVMLCLGNATATGAISPKWKRTEPAGKLQGPSCKMAPCKLIWSKICCSCRGPSIGAERCKKTRPAIAKASTASIGINKPKLGSYRVLVLPDSKGCHTFRSVTWNNWMNFTTCEMFQSDFLGAVARRHRCSEVFALCGSFPWGKIGT